MCNSDLRVKKRSNGRYDVFFEGSPIFGATNLAEHELKAFWLRGAVERAGKEVQRIIDSLQESKVED